MSADTVVDWGIGKTTVHNTEIEEAAEEDADLTVHHHHPHLLRVTDPEEEEAAENPKRTTERDRIHLPAAAPL